MSSSFFSWKFWRLARLKGRLFSEPLMYRIVDEDGEWLSIRNSNLFWRTDVSVNSGKHTNS